VGKDHEVPGEIEGLAGAEQLVGELLARELLPGAAGAVHDEDRVGHVARGVAPGGAERHVMDAQLGELLPAGEGEVLDLVVTGCRGHAGDGLRRGGGGGGRRRGRGRGRGGGRRGRGRGRGGRLGLVVRVSTCDEQGEDDEALHGPDASRSAGKMATAGGSSDVPAISGYVGPPHFL